MLVMIYDQKGEPFEVTHNRVMKLVTEHGWTMDPPSPRPEMPLFTKIEPASASATTVIEPAPVSATTVPAA